MARTERPSRSPSSAHQPRTGSTDAPGHPAKQAAWLLIGVTILIVVLAVASSFGRV